MKKIALALLISAVVSAEPVVSHAQTVEQDGAGDSYSMATERAQKTFLAYHMAMDAQQKCNRQSFSPEDLVAMDKAIAEEMVSVSPNVSLGAARLLNLRRVADRRMDTAISRQGCDGPRVTKALQFYNERLANVHQAPLPGPAVDQHAPVVTAPTDPDMQMGDAPVLRSTAPAGAMPEPSMPEPLTPDAE